jgi:hypothetical protein
LDQECVDVDQGRLEEVEGEHRDLLALLVLAGQFAVLAVEQVVVRAVPVLDDLQALADLPAQVGVGEVVADSVESVLSSDARVGHAAAIRSVVLGEAVCQRERQFFRRGPWRSLRALTPCEMHLDETCRVVLDAEQDFVTATATGESDDGLTKQRMPFADLQAELSFQDLSGPCVRQQNPRLRQRTRLPIEQVVNAGIQPAIRPRL